MTDILQELDNKMNLAFKSLLQNFSKTRTGRANVSFLEDVTIDYYGQQTPIKQLCSIAIPEPRLVVIQPWDKTTLPIIEKAILASNIGITPDNDGNVIRLPFQPLTEETRKEIVKKIKKMAEEAKITIRNIRREGNESAKKAEKKSEITEDDLKKFLKDNQELTDKWVNKIGEATKSKDREIMEV